LSAPAALALALVVLTLGGCAGCNAGPPPEDGAATPDGEPRRGGQAVIAMGADITGVNNLIARTNNPTESLLRLVYLQLVRERIDWEKGPPTFEPNLAERWEWSDDHLTITFHLRRDARWSDGEPVTAEDVRFSHEAQTHPDVAWDTAYYKDAVTAVEVVDPHTIRFTFSHVYPSQLLELNEGYIFPAHVYGRIPFSEWRTRGQWFLDNAVYAGPFVIASWTPQQEILLERNPSYFDPELPRLDRAVFRIIPDPANRLTQLLSGSIHFTDGVSPEAAERIRREPGVELIDYWGPSFIFLGWNTRREPFDDPEMRRALTMAIDRQTLVDNVWGEFGRISNSPVIQNVWIYNRDLEPWPYDPQRARRMLADLGWTDSDGDGTLDKGGEKLAFELATNSDNRQRMDAAVLIQSQLAQIGVEVAPRGMEFQSLITRIEAGDFQATIQGWTMPTGLDFKFAFHTDEIGDGNNINGYSNPEVDRLLDEFRVQPEVADGEPLLLRLQELLHQDLPYTFLWESKRAVGVSGRLRDVRPGAVYFHENLPEWWLAE
jgi:peptide/nickel transport system substrate-binding protein